jgi:hypothetical protein
VLFTATGPGVATVLRLPRRALPIRLGWSYLLGVAYLGGALYATSHLFLFPLRRSVVLAIAALPVAAAAVRRRPSPAAPSGRTTWRAGELALVVAAGSVGSLMSLAVLAEAASSPPTDWDGRMTWCAQARFIRGARTVDAPVLREARWYVTHPRYPVLLPLAQVAVEEVLDAAEDDRVVRPLYALFLPALLLVVYDSASRLAGRRIAALWTLVAAMTPFLAWKNGGAGGCYSDLPLGCFFGGGLAILCLGPRRLSTGLSGGLLLGAGVLTKNEGLPFAILALGALALASTRHARLRPWRDPRLLGALCVVAATAALLFSWRSAIPNRYDDFFFETASPGALASGLARNGKEILGCVTALMASRASWGFLWFALPMLAALGWRGLLRRRALPLWIAPACAALVILAAYTLVTGDVVAFVVGSWNRFLVEVSIPVFLVGAVATRGLLCPRQGSSERSGRVTSGAEG